MLSRYRPRAPIIAVTRCGQTARQAHLYRGIYPVLYTKPASDVWAEDVDLRVNFALDVGECKKKKTYENTLFACRIHSMARFSLSLGKHRNFFKSGDVALVVTGWRPGPGYTNTVRVVLVP